jgi:hypothetical protein
VEAKWKVVITAVVFAAIGFALESNGPIGQTIRPAFDNGSEPQGGALAGFIAYGLIEALVFLLFGLPAVKRALPGREPLATGAYLAIGWLLVNWVPYSALHMSTRRTGGAASSGSSTASTRRSSSRASRSCASCSPSAAAPRRPQAP